MAHVYSDSELKEMTQALVDWATQKPIQFKKNSDWVDWSKNYINPQDLVQDGYMIRPRPELRYTNVSNLPRPCFILLSNNVECIPTSYDNNNNRIFISGWRSIPELVEEGAKYSDGKFPYKPLTI